MKIVVTDGYVSIARNLYRAGAEIDIDDATAKSLITKGVAVPVSGSDSVEIARDNEDNEEEGMESAVLPSVDPAAAAKKTRGKKK